MASAAPAACYLLNAITGARHPDRSRLPDAAVRHALRRRLQPDGRSPPRRQRRRAEPPHQPEHRRRRRASTRRSIRPEPLPAAAYAQQRRRRGRDAPVRHRRRDRSVDASRVTRAANGGALIAVGPLGVNTSIDVGVRHLAARQHGVRGLERRRRFRALHDQPGHAARPRSIGTIGTGHGDQRPDGDAAGLSVRRRRRPAPSSTPTCCSPTRPPRRCR